MIASWLAGTPNLEDHPTEVRVHLRASAEVPGQVRSVTPKTVVVIVRESVPKIPETNSGLGIIGRIICPVRFWGLFLAKTADIFQLSNFDIL